ncbi:MAG: hypothetical protein ACXVZN_09370 [Gaiellaceae bacterium]
MRYAIRSVALAAALAIFLIGSSGTARPDDSAWKATHDTDPHLPLTAEQVEMTAEKRAAEPEDGAAVPGLSLAPLVVCSNCDGGGYPTSAHLAANQTPQTTSYYCGPASVHEALGSIGISLSQAAAATRLHTTTQGTAWSGGGTSPSGYPVPDVLNGTESKNYYVPQPVSSPATSTAVSRYEGDLRMNIYGVGVPLIGDAWEVPGGPHLVGHPTNREIFHWFEIRGYQSSGGSTMYEDSVHGASSISWSGSVPAYSTLASSTIVKIISGRGYVW